MLRSTILWALIATSAIAWMAWPKQGTAVTSGQPAPDIAGENWLNSKPLTIGDLKGRVVMVEFWTYG